jgi:hypothetical protein
VETPYLDKVVALAGMGELYTRIHSHAEHMRSVLRQPLHPGAGHGFNRPQSWNLLSHHAHGELERSHPSIRDQVSDHLRQVHSALRIHDHAAAIMHLHHAANVAQSNGMPHTHADLRQHASGLGHEVAEHTAGIGHTGGPGTPFRNPLREAQHFLTTPSLHQMQPERYHPSGAPISTGRSVRGSLAGH